MKKGNALAWTVGRVLLAVVLLVAVFRYVVKLDDTVHLVDGTQISGRIDYERDGAVALKGHPRPYAAAEIAVRPDSDVVRLADRKEVRGTITSLDDERVIIRVRKAAVVYKRAQASVQRGDPWVDRGLITLLKRMSLAEYAYGFILLGIPPIVGGIRWKMLLAAQEIRTTQYRAFELTMIGLFFNNVMPGLTGGDVVKAYYAAKLTADKKTHAVVTVLLDRIIGMVALGVVAGVAILVGIVSSEALADASYREAAWFVLIFVAISLAGGIAFYSRRLRRLLSGWVGAMPGYRRVRRIGIVDKAVGLAKRVDSALFMYRTKKRVLLNATLISFVAHASAILAIYFFGRALGITRVALRHYFAVVPVGFIISSIGVTPSGWGLGEVVFKVLFGAVGVAGTAAVTMSVIYRLTQALWTLPGGVMLLFQRERVAVEEAEEVEGELEAKLVEGQDGAAGD